MMLHRDYSIFGIFGVRGDEIGISEKLQSRGLPEDNNESSTIYNLSIEVEDRLKELKVLKEYTKVEILDDVGDIEYTEKSNSFLPADTRNPKKIENLEAGDEILVSEEAYYQIPRASRRRTSREFELDESIDAHDITYFYVDEIKEFVRENRENQNRLRFSIQDGEKWENRSLAQVSNLIDLDLSSNNYNYENFQKKMKEQEHVSSMEEFVFDLSEYEYDYMVSIHDESPIETAMNPQFEKLLELMDSLDDTYDGVRAIIWFDN